LIYTMMRKMMYRIPLKNKKNTFYNSQWSVGRSGGQRWSTDMIISFFKAILNEQKKRGRWGGYDSKIFKLYNCKCVRNSPNY
jgi:hypothetical protein